MSAYPKPKLDLFNDSSSLISKKKRTSTPSLKPPKPPTKSSLKRRQRGSLEQGQYRLSQDDDMIIESIDPHEGSFSYNLQNDSIENSKNDDNNGRMYEKFEITSKIGSGYFADVYKAKSLEDGQYYAIKRTSIPYTSNSDRLRKLQEVKNHQSIPPHPNCLRYFDSWEEDGYVYIQTELCKTSLNEVLESSEEHKLPEHIVWGYLLDLLSAVKHLHDHDLIHLDIKPDNIFISFDGVAKLGDFGLVCHCSDFDSSFNNHNDSGCINRSDDSIDSIDEGDSKYLASETMQGKFTKAADIFSLGITMFEVASGLDLPQGGETYHKLRQNEIDDLYLCGLSPDLVKVIKMMMEKDYTKRPSVGYLLNLVTVLTN